MEFKRPENKKNDNNDEVRSLKKKVNPVANRKWFRADAATSNQEKTATAEHIENKLHNELTKEDDNGGLRSRRNIQVNPAMSRKRVSDDFSTTNVDFENNNKKQKTLMSDKDVEKNLHSTLAWQWANIMKDGLLQTVKNDLQAEYSPTGDYDLLAPPNVNTDLKYSLNQQYLQADQCYVNIQEQITSALVGIGKIIASALTCNDSRLFDADILIDVAMLLGNIHHDISLQRRSTIISAFDLEGITDISQVNKTLFGEKLMNIINSARVLPNCKSEDDKSKDWLIESAANESKNLEKTVNDSSAIRSENLEKTAKDSAATGSKNPEKNVNAADENLQEKSKSDAEDSAKTPSLENKDSEANKTIDLEINKNSQESSKRVERSEENEIGTKSLEGESAKNAQLPSGTSGAAENHLREKSVNDEASTAGAKSTDKNDDSLEKILQPTPADNTHGSAKAANAPEKDLPGMRTDGTGSQKNSKELSSKATYPNGIINPAEINGEDKSKSNVDADKNNETADIILLEVKNASLRVIEEMDVALKKKLEALQVDHACVKPEKKVSKFVEQIPKIDLSI